MAKHDAPVAEKPTAEQLLARVEQLEAREKQHWKVVQNFLAKFGTYYNIAGDGSLFIVHRYVQSGVNGVALTPHQGLVEQFGLPIKTSRPSSEIDRPCFVPEIIPEIEVSEPDGGDNSQAVE